MIHMFVLLAAIAPPAGAHFPTVRQISTGPAANSANTKGRTLIAAENDVAEGQRLKMEWNAASLRGALQRYGSAARYYQAAGDRRSCADALNKMAEIFVILGQNRTAVIYYQRALSNGIGSGQEVESDSLNGLSAAYLDLGISEKAAEYGERALQRSRAAKYHAGEAQALNNLALIDYYHSNSTSALEQFDSALRLWRQIDDRRGQAETLTNIAYTYSDLGDAKAIPTFNQALALWELAMDKRGKALVLTALGLEYTWLGEMQKALDSHKDAYQILKDLGSSRGQAVALSGMGHTYDVLGEKKTALALFFRALKLHRAAGRRYGEALTLGHIGRLYYSSGDYAKAYLFFKRKLDMVSVLGDPRAQGYTLKDIGAVFDSLNKKPEALAYYQRALSLSGEANDLRGQAYCLSRIGYMRYQDGEKQEALKLYLRALTLLRQAEDAGGLISISYNIARVKRDLGDVAGALQQIQSALDTIETLRVKLDSGDLRSSYFASVQQCYKLAVDLLMSMHLQNPAAGYDVAAFEMSERSRARTLLDALAEARLDFKDGSDAGLLQRERDIQKLLTAEVSMLSTGARSAQLSNVKEQIAELTREYDELQAHIRMINPRYAALTQPRILTLSEVQKKVVDSESVLLEYSLGEERSYLWAITSSTISSFVLPKEEEIEKLSRRVFDLLSSDDYSSKPLFGRHSANYLQADREYWTSATRLSQLLLGPAAMLVKDKRLLIAPDGALQYVPFSALPEPDVDNVRSSETDVLARVQPLFLNHEIVNISSASTLGFLGERMSPDTLSSRAVAVFADPVFESDDPRVKTAHGPASRGKVVSDQTYQRSRGHHRAGLGSGRERFPRLLGSKREGETILAFAMRDRSLLATGFEASLDTLLSADMTRYRVVHFATHGMFESEHPELSSIVLSLVDDRGRPRKGLLRLHEIYKLRMPVDLVVLSACETALGKNIRGEGLVGLTRGFMYAGAAQIISSMWRVDDDATTEFMKHLYRSMLVDGQTPLAALRSAETAMWRQEQWRSPCYWASFLFYGKWK